MDGMHVYMKYMKLLQDKSFNSWRVGSAVKIRWISVQFSAASLCRGGGLQLPSLQLSESQHLFKDIHTLLIFIHIHIKNKHT